MKVENKKFIDQRYGDTISIKRIEKDINALKMLLTKQHSAINISVIEQTIIDLEYDLKLIRAELKQEMFELN